LVKKRIVKKKSNSNRIWVVLAGLLLVGVVAIIIFSLVKPAVKRMDLPKWIIDQVPAEVSGEAFNAVAQGLIDWDRVHTCGREITLRSIPKTTTSNEEIEGQGEPGIISIYFNYSLTELRKIVLHEATHACVGEITLLPRPAHYSGGEIIGFQGLAILLQPIGQEQGFFRKCEEGFAERGAYDFPEYSNPNKGYSAVGEYIKELYPNSREADELRRTNGFLEFVAKARDIDQFEVTPTDIEAVMQNCQILISTK
jgi:hypothetical protein